MENRAKGRKGELIAQKWIRSKLRLDILETNFRSPWGEIDIIAKDRDTWVFLEVKMRESLKAGLPEEAVTKEKQNKIRRSALFYLQRKGYNPEEVCFRFDVLAIQKEKGKLQFSYYPGSF
ncbi:MAG: putative endonuclease [Candidatus Atribacteria bacterium]|nr:putative endonuclease [Candidatus Atribacteria bacterium]